MPSWAIHLAVATQLNKKIKLNEQNKNIFLLGNILPDILNGYVIKNISHIVPHREAHMEIPEKFENPMMLGYYTHLLTDFYWNDLTYGRLGVFDKNKNLIGLKMYNEKIYMAPKAELRKIKTNDFKLFSKSIYENKCTDIPTYDEKMLEYAEELKWLDLQKCDILEGIKYLENMASLKTKLEIECPDYIIFSEKEMQEHLKKCVDFIKNSEISWDFIS